MALYIRAVHTLTIVRCGRCHEMSTAVSELPSPPQLRLRAAPAAAPSAAPALATSSKLIATEKMNPEAEGATPLMYACQQGREAELKSIMTKKPGAVRERDRTQKTALHYCAESATVSCAGEVLEAAPELLDARDKDGYTTLHLATIAGNCPLIRLLLGRGAAVNCLDNERHSVVHWATVCGEVEALETVLSAGAEASTPDMHGGYPLHYAAQMCGPAGELTSTRLGLAVLRTLLAHGVEVNVTDQDGRQPILWAASAGSADAILALVNAGANVEADDKDGLTALHCAASRGHTDCLETLVSLCGAAVDVMDSNGCTPLFYAVTLGHADATQLLLEHGAQPNRQDRKGRTPAHCGAAKGQLETLRILGSRSANMWARNVKGDYPLHEAVASGRKDLVRWLLSQRPDAVNASNNDGRCPLHIAAINNNVEICKILLDHESLVNPVMRSSKGGLMTPLDAALYKGNRGCAKYLQLHGGVPANKLTSHSAALRGILQRGEPHSDQMATPDWGANLAVPDLRQAQSLVHSPVDLKHLGLDATRTLEVRVEDELHRRGSGSSTDDKIKRRRRKRRPKRISDGSEEETDSSDRHRRRRRRRRKDVKHSSEEDSDVDNRRQKAKSKIDKDSLESESEGTPKRKKKDAKHHRRRSVSFDREKEDENKDKAEEEYFDKTYEETKITENDGAADGKPSDKQKESRRFLKEEIKTKEVTKSKKVIEHKEKEKSSSNPTVTKTSKTTCEETKTEEQITTKTSKIVSNSSDSKADELSTQESQDIPAQQVVTAIVHQEESAEHDGTNNQNNTQDQTNQNDGDSDLKLSSTSEIDKTGTEGVVTEQEHDQNLEESKETEKELPDDADFWGENNDTPGEKEKENEQCAETTNHEPPETISNSADINQTVEPVEDKKDNDVDMGVQIAETTGNVDGFGEDGGVNEVSASLEQQDTITSEDKQPIEQPVETNELQKNDLDSQDSKNYREETDRADDLNSSENLECDRTGDEVTAQQTIETSVGGEDANIESRIKEGEVITNLEGEENISSMLSESLIDAEQRRETDETEAPGGSDTVTEKGLIKVLGRSEVEDEHLKGFVKVEKINSEVLKDRGRERERVRERRRPSSFEIVSPARSLPDEEFDSETPRSRSRTGADSSQLQDSGFEPSPRRDSKRDMSRIPRACRRSSSHHQLGGDSDDDRPPLSTISVTQAVQHSMRKYHLERRLFHELLELKRLQIRAGRSNEAVLVKRLVDDYRRAGLCIGLKPYEGVYTFRGFEKYLYDQLRLLQSSDRRIIPRLKSTDDLEKLTRALRKTRAGNTLLDNVPADPLVCTHGTHRCYHATHAYTGVPCAAYIAKINHHTMPKPGPPAASFLPRIDSGKQRMEGQAAEIARCLRYVDPSRPVTLELSHGAERQVISLPTEKLDKNKRYYVTFTIKGGDVTPGAHDKEKHRHAKSF